jgi:hypothetical protein
VYTVESVYSRAIVTSGQVRSLFTCLDSGVDRLTVNQADFVAKLRASMNEQNHIQQTAVGAACGNVKSLLPKAGRYSIAAFPKIAVMRMKTRKRTVKYSRLMFDESI